MLMNSFGKAVTLANCLCLSLICLANISYAQPSDFSRLLDGGEYSLALEQAQAQTDQQIRDRLFQQIAESQRQNDTGVNAFSTLGMIQNDQLRMGSFEKLTAYRDRFGSGEANAAGSPLPAQRGGVTEADFGELMDLIQETIDPDSWEENGGVGRMSPFPAGVWIDSTGTLKQIKRDRSGRLEKYRRSTRNMASDKSELPESQLRKISLSRLETELQRRAATGQKLTPDLQHLAGIYELKYVMLYPETGDVVIAGPAGPWDFDRDGRAVNQETGKPVLNLEDLISCLQNAKNEGGKFGCSIDPRPANLVNARQVVDTSQLKGKALRDRLHEALGQMDVTVQGVAPNSHAASVIVEADYRMKLIGLGVMPSVSGLRNYFQRIHLDDDGQLPEVDQLVRWWFTMNYDSVVTNEDRTIFELNGQGVRLLSESEFWTEQGERVHTGTSSPAASGYAVDFTSRFEEIAIRDPVFGELKNVFDCALAANIIHQEKLDRKIDWNLRFLNGDSKAVVGSYQPALTSVPRQVDSILGQHVITHRDGPRTIRHTLSGFGGGVEFNASRHATRDNISVDETAELNEEQKRAKPQTGSASDWNWD